MALDLSNFSATGTVHMSARVTVGMHTRGNGQVNLWASSDWTADGSAGVVGTLEEGSFTFEDPLSAGTNIVIRRFAKWSSGDRLIMNTTGTGNIGNLFDDTTDPYRLTIIRENADDVTMFTWMPESTNGGTGFVDWRRSHGDQTLAMWNFIDGIVDDQSVILAIHQGAASYTEPVTDRDASLSAESGDPEFAVTAEAEILNREASLSAESGEPEFSATPEAEDITVTDRDASYSAESGEPEAAFGARAEAVTNRDASFAAVSGLPLAAIHPEGVGATVRSASFAAETGEPEVSIGAVADDRGSLVEVPGTPFENLPVYASVELTDEIAVARGEMTGRMPVERIAERAAAFVAPGAAGTGMPSFAASGLAWEDASNTIRGDVNNFQGNLPLPSFVAFIVPNDIPRNADPVLLALNSGMAAGLPIRGVLNQEIRARDLTPNCIHLSVRAGGNFRLLDPLGPRPQDWPFVYGLTQTLLTQAQADALTVSMVNSDFEIPGSFNSGTDVFWFGIPADNVPGASRLVSLPGENRTLADFRPAAGLNNFVAPNYMGEAFTWYYISSRSEPLPHTYRLIYDYDNY